MVFWGSPVKRPHQPSASWGGNILILTISRCIWQFSTSIPRPFLPLYIIALGGTAREIGLITSLAALAGLFLYPVGGYVADHKGRVKLVGSITYLYAVSFLFFAFATHWTTIAVGSFFQNFFLFYVPALFAIEADSLPPSRRGAGFAAILAIPGALGILGPFIGGYMIEIYGIIDANRMLYIVGFVAGIVVATMRMLRLKETLREVKQSPPVRDFPLLLKESYRGFLTTMKSMSETLKSLSLILALNTFFVSIASPFWVLYAQDRLGFTAGQWGQLALVAGAARFALAIPAGRLADRYGRRRLILIPLAIAPLLTLSFVFSSTFYEVLLLFAALEAGNAFLMPTFQALTADAVPRDKRGRVLSALGSGMFFVDVRGMMWGGGVFPFLSMTAASFIGGLLYTMDESLPFLILTAGLVASLMLSIRFVHDPERPEE